MYVAPGEVRQANEQWLAEVCRILGVIRRKAEWPGLDSLWLAPQLLLTQSCGYPLMTRLRGQVKVIGRPSHDLPHASGGNHHSLLLSREGDGRSLLAEYYGSAGVINEDTSNTGMNLLRQRLLALRKEGRFFAAVGRSGGHRESLRWLRERRADLAAVDSITFAYLSRFAPAEVTGLKIVALSAQSPCLPYIGSVGLTEVQVLLIRQAMNQALLDLPWVRSVLGIDSVLPAAQADYEVVLSYEQQARAAGFTL